MKITLEVIYVTKSYVTRCLSTTKQRAKVFKRGYGLHMTAAIPTEGRPRPAIRDSAYRLIVMFSNLM